jgi:hypothetical protein
MIITELQGIEQKQRILSRFVEMRSLFEGMILETAIVFGEGKCDRTQEN